MNSPVEQFTIKTLYELNFMGIDVSFTNASLFMMLSILGSVCFLYLGSGVFLIFEKDNAAVNLAGPFKTLGAVLLQARREKSILTVGKQKPN